jgi:Na+-driven multidrug efflux pump
VSCASGLNLNVYGAGLAATLSTWVSCITLVGLMLKRKVLDPADLAVPPTGAEIVPYLWKGAVLAFRMVVTFGEQQGTVCACCCCFVLLVVLNVCLGT